MPKEENCKQCAQRVKICIEEHREEKMRGVQDLFEIPWNDRLLEES
jgi:hypothetical protein